MSSTIVLTTIVVFGFIVGSYLQRLQQPNFIFSGIIYVSLGMVLGPLGLDILSTEFIARLQPLTSLLIGIVGYLLGLRVKGLFVGPSVLLAGIVTAALVLVAVCGVFLIISPYLLTENLFTIEFYPLTIGGTHFRPTVEVNQLWFCIGIGAAACAASFLSSGAARRVNEGDSEITKALSLMTGTLQCIAVVALGLCLANARAPLVIEQVQIDLLTWLMISVFAGVVCGFLFSIFIGRQSNADLVLLAGLGTIVFASGIGISMGISSLFVAFVAGTTISFVSSYERLLRENLSKIEMPIFIVLLIIGGAMWRPELTSIWILPLCYFLVRFVVVSIAPQLIYLGVHGHHLHRLGQGLLGQDLTAVAIAISFSQQFPDLAQFFLTTIFGSIFINDFFADRLLKRVISDNELKTSVLIIKAQEGPP